MTISREKPGNLFGITFYYTSNGLVNITFN